MSSLDCYLLISLLFIIGTKVELAFILILKRKFGLSNIKRKTARETNKTKSQNDQNAYPVDVCRVEPTENLEHESKVFKVKEIVDIQKKNGLLRFLMAMSLTNRIDFVAFFIFTIAYIIFNCVYWIRFD